MAAVTLRKADLALVADLSVRVQLPHLVALAPVRRYAGTAVTFAGDALPTPFRGTSRDRTWQLTCLYGHTEQTELAALLNLLERAADGPDVRLLLRTHHGQIPGIDTVAAVQVLEVAPTPGRGVLTEVGFTAQAVVWTPEV